MEIFIAGNIMIAVKTRFSVALKDISPSSSLFTQWIEI
jgi:hypothetical protein